LAAATLAAAFLMFGMPDYDAARPATEPAGVG
jgi:hypothetical protein